MATRSFIGIEKNNGEYFGVYCHCDGYLTHNGAILIDHYNSKARVEKLLKLGNLSYLGQKIDPDPDYTHSFSKPQEGVVIAYGRDRGEEDVAAKETTLEAINDDPWIDYAYFFGKDGKWKYFTHGDLKEKGLRDLEQGLEEEFKGIGIRRPEGVYGYYPPQFVRKLKQLQKEEDEVAKSKKAKSGPSL